METLDILNKIVLLCGKRNSGKSRLLRYILCMEKHNFQNIFLFCPTEEVNGFYKDVVPSSNIFKEYTEEWGNKLFKKMTEVNSNKPCDECTHVLVILDDCCSDTNFRTSQSFKKMCTRGRHLKISVIITSQYLYQLPPVARSNCDYVACSQMNSQAIKILCDEFCHGSVTKKQFVKFYYQATGNYGFLLINNNCAKNNDDIHEIYGILRTPKEYIE
jgi:hypothetical protein